MPTYYGYNNDSSDKLELIIRRRTPTSGIPPTYIWATSTGTCFKRLTGHPLRSPTPSLKIPTRLMEWNQTWDMLSLSVRLSGGTTASNRWKNAMASALRAHGLHNPLWGGFVTAATQDSLQRFTS